MVGDIIKRYFIIMVLAFIALAGQAYAYTPEQQTLIDGMNLRCQLCTAYEKAIQGQNVAEYNTLVDTYNAWIRQHFKEGADALLMSKITTPNLPSAAPAKNPSLTAHEAPINPLVAENLSIVNPPGSRSYFVTKNPYKAGSNLSKFGQQQARVDIGGEAKNIEELSVQEKLKNF
jgi:hypothetical protein